MIPAHRNPFRTERLEALRFRLDAAGWSALLARGEALAWRAVLVGPPGSGKTTLLEELHDRLADRFPRRLRLRLQADDARPARTLARHLAALPEDGLLCLDGGERLGAWDWWRLRRRWCGALLATSHRRTPLPVLRRHATDAGLLRDLAVELAGPTAAALPHDELWGRHRGDLRACLLSFYDRWAAAPAADQ